MFASTMLDLVGKTPILRLNRLGRETGTEILVKIERTNPSGSTKDRFALAVIEDAERKGLLKPGATIIEATSGNTGISLAMVAAIKGYKLLAFMPESMSEERAQMMRAFGAEMILTPKEGNVAGAAKAAEEYAASHPDAFAPRQFENQVNPLVHEQTTAKEILDSVNGRIDAFVAGVGTGGTFLGVARGLRTRNPDLLAVAVYPSSKETHVIQGIGDGFEPEIMKGARIDRKIRVSDEHALSTAKALARKEGLLAGISTGANVWAALSLAAELGPGKRIVTVAPDNGERYLSMGVFG